MIRRNPGSGQVPVAPAGDGRGAGLGPQLGVDAVHVILDSLLGEHQMGRDLAVGVTLGDERHDLGFAQGQAERAGQAGDAAGPHRTSGPRLPAVRDVTHGTKAATRSARVRNGTNCTRLLCAVLAWAAGQRRAGPRRAGQPTFEPVIRLLGTGWPFLIALNMRCTLAWSQTRTSPTASVSEPPMGTVVVSGWRSANATWTS